MIKVVLDFVRSLDLQVGASYEYKLSSLSPQVMRVILIILYQNAIF